MRKAVILLLAISLLFTSQAFAKVMKTGAQAGIDMGAMLTGLVIPAGSAKLPDENDNYHSCDLNSGNVGAGPAFGVHFNAWPAKSWLIRVETGYQYQPGTLTFKFDPKLKGESSKDSRDFGLHQYKVGFGIGTRFGNNKRIIPQGIVGLDWYYQWFKDKQDKRLMPGQAIGLFGMLGLDVMIDQHFSAGLFLRVDPMYNYAKYTKSKEEATLSYVPLSLMLSGGYNF